VPIGPGTLTAGVGTGKTKNVDGSKATQLSLGYDYSLSKRTNLYVIGTAINNGSGTAYTADAATGSGPPVSAGNNVHALLIGVRHRF
jgi:predicted porin